MSKSHKSPMTMAMEKLTRLSYSTLFSIWLVMAGGFGALYFLLSTFVPAHGPTQLQADPTLLIRLLDSVYFSIITATSTGYGDITPQGFSKVLAALQSIMALMVFAIFVTKLLSHKQEIALQQVHRLTFEDVFHNMREGFYIVRKDCDRIIAYAEEHKQLNENLWRDLVIAYEQTQSLLQEIPDFYANGDSTELLHTIDEKRERLLHESVHRTLRRINHMLDTLSRNDINWTAHTESLEELKTLVTLVDVVMPLWEESSPYTEVFEDIIHLNTSISEQLKFAVGHEE